MCKPVFRPFVYYIILYYIYYIAVIRGQRTDYVRITYKNQSHRETGYMKVSKHNEINDTNKQVAARLTATRLFSNDRCVDIHPSIFFPSADSSYISIN